MSTTCPPQRAISWVTYWFYPPSQTQLLFLSNIFTHNTPSPTAHSDALLKLPEKLTGTPTSPTSTDR
ncbi:hypothetical protein ASPSYDRAFT_43367 [Aspergillus sydowii CBS 593.65]|uniref:Uncharacterized protein n=1 Tax=Aspergillus sydowii CBS 593.65 TaxID=1036612 RepID=A0A1L9TPS7_9EURO|nr:uncharacterized protein ASPSYDRAFT_43367 [Aspergillus sydowii CBS 593.65]OJJ61430.1 hypothetical protein ASPSYDRAFT_43367 [Aspergillus sydowii CBS 593.65]